MSGLAKVSLVQMYERARASEKKQKRPAPVMDAALSVAVPRVDGDGTVGITVGTKTGMDKGGKPYTTIGVFLQSYAADGSKAGRERYLWPAELGAILTHAATIGSALGVGPSKAARKARAGEATDAAKASE